MWSVGSYAATQNFNCRFQIPNPISKARKSNIRSYSRTKQHEEAQTGGGGGIPPSELVWLPLELPYRCPYLLELERDDLLENLIDAWYFQRK
ncbi:hypothetical protein OQA88_5902 [Cercophora sp. LCS_1]